ncbi:MAG: response regulator transcription factor [Chloroflexi bacterium]|nr:response regulator transcription factor [Chloroflexota bacterium]
MKNILVVDDDKAIVWALTANLHHYGYTVNSVQNGVDALRQIQSQQPDLVLLDIDLPGMDGVEVCGRLRSDPRSSLLPIIFLTGLSELRDMRAAYAVGADDYVGKPFSMPELLMRISAVLRRAKNQQLPEVQKPTPPHQLQIGPLQLNLNSSTLETEHRVVGLTPNELSLMKYLMHHPNQTFSSEKLLQEVWLYPPGTGDPALVRWHVKNLRRKLEPKPDQPIYLHTIPHHGYILVDPPRPYQATLPRPATQLRANRQDKALYQAVG